MFPSVSSFMRKYGLLLTTAIAVHWTLEANVASGPWKPASPEHPGGKLAAADQAPPAAEANRQAAVRSPEQPVAAVAAIARGNEQPDTHLHAEPTESESVGAGLATIGTTAELMELSKRVPLLHDMNELQKSRKVTVMATGYYAGPESTGKRPGDKNYGITYSGVKVRRDVYLTIAADPNVFPIGTELYVPGYGYAIVADTGSAIKGRRIDLYFDSKDKVYKEWGKRQVEVVVIRMGKGKLTEEMMRRYNEIALPVKAKIAEDTY